MSDLSPTWLLLGMAVALALCATDAILHDDIEWVAVLTPAAFVMFAAAVMTR